MPDDINIQDGCAAGQQPLLFPDVPALEIICRAIADILSSRAQPSAWELLSALDVMLGPKARWVIGPAMQRLADDHSLTRSYRMYIGDLLKSEDWQAAIHGGKNPAHGIKSTVDELFCESAAYRSSKTFQEMVSFMANFPDYAPYNNMLVRLQNPSCSFFATQWDWASRFKRSLKEDARPMLILAPKHPVMLVYDLDSTEGAELPQELRQFANFKGDWDPERLRRTVANAWTHDLIHVGTVKLSSTNAGFATVSTGQDGMKMRIGLHSELNEPSTYGVLLHELAHIYLGHLGGDKDGWWPSRWGLPLRTMEVEAETVAYIVSRRAYLKGASAQYVSRYLDSEETLRAISLDFMAKVADRLEHMGTTTLARRPPRRTPSRPPKTPSLGTT